MLVSGLENEPSYELQVPQVPSESGAEARSIVRLEMSRPDWPSLPSSNENGTEAVVNQGPPVTSIDWPAGAVESAEIVIVSVAVVPEPLVATTVSAVGAVAPAPHE